MKKELKCCICGRKFIGYGNNPRPVKWKGRCCDYCDSRYVIPARIELFYEERRREVEQRWRINQKNDWV